MNRYLLFLIIGITPIISLSQRSTVTAGGEATGTNGYYSYSIGQVFYQNIENGSGFISEGVQQPFEIWITDVYENPGINLSFTAYPNPTLNELWLKIENYNQEELKLQLLDINGKQIELVQINSSETKLLMTDHATGMYFINVLEQDIPIKNFKIIKN
jgi:hypothetical protein